MTHNAHTRAKPVAWTNDDRMIYAEADAHPLYELICLDCGDDAGPEDRQPDQIRALRGPFSDVFAARAALQQHIMST